MARRVRALPDRYVVTSDGKIVYEHMPAPPSTRYRPAQVLTSKRCGDLRLTTNKGDSLMASLLIPGTGGTTLLKNGVNLGHPAVLNLRLWLFKTAGIDIQETVLDMSMEHLSDQLAPTKTTLCPDATVGPGVALTAAYNLILDKVDQTFCYDWRDCIEHSATKLLTFFENKPGDQRWRRQPFSGRIGAHRREQTQRTREPSSTFFGSRQPHQLRRLPAVRHHQCCPGVAGR